MADVEYSYDGNGNLTDDGVQTYYYDFENRLTRAVRNSDGQTLAEYRYDPFGRRAKKITANGATVVNYLYDGAQVIEERNGDFELERRFVYGSGIDEPLTLHDESSSELYFYQRDGLGSVTELTDDQGDVIEHYRYSPYGKRKIYNSSWSEISSTSTENPYYFTGRRFDEETGLYYYRARMYSAEIGRFLQVDLFEYIIDNNIYRYVFNNPPNYIDPLGMAYRRPGETYDDCMERCMNEQNALTKGVRNTADFVGYYGITSTVVNVGGSLVFKGIQTGATSVARNAPLCGAKAGGSIWKRQAVGTTAAKVGKVAGTLSKVTSVVAKVTVVASVVGSAVSLAVRTPCYVRCCTRPKS